MSFVSTAICDYMRLCCSLMGSYCSSILSTTKPVKSGTVPEKDGSLAAQDLRNIMDFEFSFHFDTLYSLEDNDPVFTWY